MVEKQIWMIPAKGVHLLQLKTGYKNNIFINIMNYYTTPIYYNHSIYDQDDYVEDQVIEGRLRSIA